MWVGIDDTDSPHGGCTSFTLTEVIRAGLAGGLDVIGEPRLVRLNPNVPTKTRGNAALAVRFGHGVGPRRWQGQLDGSRLWAYARGRAPSSSEFETVVESAWRTVLANSQLGVPGTDPVLVASRRPLPASLYQEAVGRWVEPAEVLTLAARVGAEVRAGADLGGIVGAAAAVSWPARRRTWELIAYRPPERWGTTRRVDPDSVRRAQRRHPDLFLCYDGRTRRLLVAPHTPCPILFGLRSRRRHGLLGAGAEVEAEPAERWAIFCTNQGTGDHVRPRDVRELRPYDAAALQGTVNSGAERLPGGHVRWTLRDRFGDLVTCWAFEPTKTLPPVAARLRRGDRIRVWGGRGADPAFRVEGIAWVARSPEGDRRAPPECVACGRRARSLGRLRGYRCPTCHTRFAPERARPVLADGPALGVHHPTPSARRHLAPLGPESVALT